MHSEKGRHFEFSMEPLLTFGLGSGTKPKNRLLLRASIKANSFFLMFSSILNLFFTKCIFYLSKYFVGIAFVSRFVTFLFSNFHFLKPPFKIEIKFNG